MPQKWHKDLGQQAGARLQLCHLGWCLEHIIHHSWMCWVLPLWLRLLGPHRSQAHPERGTSSRKAKMQAAHSRYFHPHTLVRREISKN